MFNKKQLQINNVVKKIKAAFGKFILLKKNYSKKKKFMKKIIRKNKENIFRKK